MADNEHEKLHQELHQKYTEMQYMEEHFQKLQKYYKDYETKLSDIAAIKESIDDLKKQNKNSEILVPVANGIFVKAKLSENKSFLVNVGSDVVVEKDSESAKTLLDEQAKEINTYKDNIYQQMMNISEQIRLTESEIKRLQNDHKH
ncbi:MAG: prefoldin subunit alpha [Candidatus Woesearchaeota archaeon]